MLRNGQWHIIFDLEKVEHDVTKVNIWKYNFEVNELRLVIFVWKRPLTWFKKKSRQQLQWLVCLCKRLTKIDSHEFSVLTIKKTSYLIPSLNSNMTNVAVKNCNLYLTDTYILAQSDVCSICACSFCISNTC